MPGTAATRPKALPRHLGRFDVFFFLICTLVGLDTIGSVAKNGAQGFTWLAFLAAFFFVPYGLLAAELGSTFTSEGGPYVWTHLAFGPFVAAVNAVIYWISVPIWVGGSLAITAVTAAGDLLVPLGNTGKHLLALGFVIFTVGSAILSLTLGQWVTVAGAWARFLVLAFFTASVGLFAWQHGIHGFTAHDFRPTYAMFIASVPVIVYNYVGFELPNAAGEEMKDPQRDVPVAVARAALCTVLLYGLPTLAILVVLPVGRVTGLAGFLDAIKAVFTVYGGTISPSGVVTLTGAGRALGALAAAAFVLALASSGTTWVMGADRVLAVAAGDSGGPPVLGRFSARLSCPVIAHLLSLVVSVMVMALAFRLSNGDADKYFAAVLGLAISTTTISYLAIFPALIRLRATQPAASRPYRIPGGAAGAWLCSGLATLWTLLGTIGLLWPGFGVGWFGGKGDPDGALPTGFTHERLVYELTQIVPLTLVLLAGVRFRGIGKMALTAKTQRGRKE